MPKYWGKQIFSLGRFPEVGQKQKTEKKEWEKKLKFGNNNGQLRIANATSGGARKATWTKRKVVQNLILYFFNHPNFSFDKNSKHPKYKHFYTI